MIVTIEGVFGGADLSSYVERGSFQIQAELGQRMDTCSFLLFDPAADPSFYIPPRAEIVVYDANNGDAVTDPPTAVSAYNKIVTRITQDVTGGIPTSTLYVDTLPRAIYSQQPMLLGAQTVGAGGGNVLAAGGDYPAGYRGPIAVNTFTPNVTYGGGTFLSTTATNTDPAKWTVRLFAGYVSAPQYQISGPQRSVQVNAQDYTYRLRTTVVGYVREPVTLDGAQGPILPFDPEELDMNFTLIPTSVSMIPNSNQTYPGGFYQGKPGIYFNRDVWVALWTDTHDTPAVCSCTIYWGPNHLTQVTLNPGDIVSTQSPVAGNQHLRVSFDNGTGPVYGRAYEEFITS